MLPDIHLDQITFEEMVEQAKNRIASIYPEWTDFNYHDPGITLVELFAWLKEIQQYELNHVGEAHRRKYLQLLGTDMRHRKGAEAYLRADLKESLWLPKGSCFLASGIPFETEEALTVLGNSIIQCFGFYEKRVSYMSVEQMDLGHLLEFYPFGRKALPETEFYIEFSKALPCGEEVHLTVKTKNIMEVPRNPAENDMTALAKIEWSFWNGSSYRPLEVIRDETNGLLFDGQFVFRLTDEMKENIVDGEKGFFLRAKLLESHYDVPPVLSFLDVNTIKVHQHETMAVLLEAEKISMEEKKLMVSHALCSRGNLQVFLEIDGCFSEIEGKNVRWETTPGVASAWITIEDKTFRKARFWVVASSQDGWYLQHKIVGISHGFPKERFDLEDSFLCYEDLEILVEEPEKPGIYRKWEKREDFSGSGPLDCHYCIDEQNGAILFGDCFCGMAPEGKILLVSYGRVLGKGGNVKDGKIREFAEDWADFPVLNPWDAKGGSEKESLDEAFTRVREELSKSRNMVTESDYEQEVLETPGLQIESCKALLGEEQANTVAVDPQLVRIVVKPCSVEKRPRLNEVLKKNILGHLEKKRLLGTRIQLLSPVYVKLSVYLEVIVRPQYQEVQKQIELTAEEYLKPYKKSFGGVISYSGMYGYLDRLDCVVTVRSLVLDAKGNGVKRNTYGDLIFPGNGIADEIQIQCSYSIED